MDANWLLESHLKNLRLATFRQQYRSVAEDAARNNLSYDRYLLALAEQEVAQRQLNSQRQRIQAAHFPLLKELADFDFSAIPQLNKQRILDLARGEYIHQKMPVISGRKSRSREKSRRNELSSGRLPAVLSGPFLQCGRAGQ